MGIYDIRIMLQCSYKCNHMCWFCDEWDNKTGNSWSIDECDIVLDKISNLPESYKNVYILFYGGEPTLCKHWEYMHFKIFEIFKDRNVLIQTQSNMSLNIDRLKSFTRLANHYIPDNIYFDVCGSYHIGKQTPERFIEKMNIVSDEALFGKISYAGEIINNLDQTLKEYDYISTNYIKNLIYLRTVAVEQYKINVSKKYLDVISSSNKYKSAGPIVDFHYLYDNYREYVFEYIPFGWKNTKTNHRGSTVWDNLYLSMCYLSMSSTIGEFDHELDANVSDYININWNRAIEKYIEGGQICGGSSRFMKCDSFQKGMVITHDLHVYSCLDNYYHNIQPIKLIEFDFENYLNPCYICPLDICVSSDTHFRKPTIMLKR